MPSVPVSRIRVKGVLYNLVQQVDDITPSEVSSMSDSSTLMKAYKDESNNNLYVASHSDIIKVLDRETLTQELFDVSNNAYNFVSSPNTPQWFLLPKEVKAGSRYQITIEFGGTFTTSESDHAWIAELRLTVGNNTNSDDIIMLSNQDWHLKKFTFVVTNDTNTAKNTLRVGLKSTYIYTNEEVSIKIVDLVPKIEKINTNVNSISTNLTTVSTKCNNLEESLLYRNLYDGNEVSFASANLYSLGYTLKANVTYKIKFTTYNLSTESTTKMVEVAFHNTMSTASGRTAWKSDSKGLSKNTTLIGDFTPSVNMNVIYIGFSSGSTKTGASFKVEVFDYNSVFSRIGSLEQNVTPERTTFFKNVAAGVNLLNSASIKSNVAINRTTGAESLGQSGKYATPLIPIDERGVYCNNAITTTSGQLGAAYYKSDETYLTSVTAGRKYASYVNNAAYVRFTMDSNENAQVNVGTTELPYEEYAGTKPQIKKEYIPSAILDNESVTFAKLANDASMEKDIWLNLPSEVVVPVGKTLQIFHKSVVQAIYPYQYEIEAVCSIGSNYPRYFTCTPNSSNSGKSYTLTYYVRRNNNTSIVSKSTTIKVVPALTSSSSPSSPFNILCVGASVFNNGGIQAEMKRMLTTSSGNGTTTMPTGLNLSNINFVGRKTVNKTIAETSINVNYEATGGYRWGDYVNGSTTYRFIASTEPSISIGATYKINGLSTLTLTVAEVNGTEVNCTFSGTGTPPNTGSLVIQSGSGDSPITYTSYTFEDSSNSPFYYNGETDFTHYAETYCNGSIDCLVFHLGVNNVFNSTVSGVEGYAKTLIDAYHTDFPNGKVILTTPALPSPTGGMGKSYGASSSYYWNIISRRMKELYDVLESISQDPLYSSYVSYVHSAIMFDIEYGYPSLSTQVNNRCTTTEKLGTNGVHPADHGLYQIADSMFFKLTEIINSLN